MKENINFPESLFKNLKLMKDIFPKIVSVSIRIIVWIIINILNNFNSSKNSLNTNLKSITE